MARKYTRLKYEDRKIIEEMLKENKSVVQIAEKLGVHRDTIYKEFLRCGVEPKDYSAEEAQKLL